MWKNTFKLAEGFMASAWLSLGSTILKGDLECSPHAGILSSRKAARL